MAVVGAIFTAIFTYAVANPIMFALGVYRLFQYLNRPAPPSPTYGSGANVTSANPRAPIAIVYGKNKIVAGVGNIIYQRFSNNRQTMYVLVGICRGPIQSITEIKINDQDINKLSGCSCNIYLGTADQVVDSRVIGGAETVGGLKFLAYLALTLSANAVKSDSIAVTCIVEGKLVQVWNGTDWVTRYSNDPAYCILDLIRSKRYGPGYTDDMIDFESFKTVSANCSEILANGLPRFALNTVIDWQESWIEVFNKLRMIFHGYAIERQGKFTLKQTVPESVSQSFTYPGSIVPDSLGIQWDGADEDYDVVRCYYTDTDPEKKWARLPAECRGLEVVNPKILTIELYGAMPRNQAARIAAFHYRLHKYCKIKGQLGTSIRAADRTPGDVIDITDARFIWDRKPVWMLTMQEDEKHDCVIGFRVYDERVFGDEESAGDSGITVEDLPNPFAVPPDVSDLILTESEYQNAIGQYISAIDVNWTLPKFEFYDHALIQISSDSGADFRDVGTSTQNSFRVDPVKVGETYLIRVISVSTKGRKSDGKVAVIHNYGCYDPPHNVESLFVEQMASGTRRFSWSYPGDMSKISGFVLRYHVGASTFWDNALPMHDGVISYMPFETGALKGGTYTVLIKAVSISGAQSADPAYSVVGLGDRLVSNVVWEADLAAAGFIGIKTGCHVEIGYLVADDPGDLMWSSDEKIPLYWNDTAPFYTAKWGGMTYLDSFIPDSGGKLSFDIEIDGNYQIYYRRVNPFAMYTNDNDYMWADDNAPMYQDGPWLLYSGPVETTAEMHEVKVNIVAGTYHGIIKRLTAIVDVDDVIETLNDIDIPAEGLRLPITKSYLKIKNVNITVQEVVGKTAFVCKVVDKSIVGPLVLPYDTNGNPAAGIIDATIQGY